MSSLHQKEVTFVSPRISWDGVNSTQKDLNKKILIFQHGFQKLIAMKSRMSLPAT